MNCLHIFHHLYPFLDIASNCFHLWMLSFSNDDLRAKLADETGHDASHVDFHPFPDLDESVRASVRRIREYPLLPESFDAHGFVYDVRTGGLREVA